MSKIFKILRRVLRIFQRKVPPGFRRLVCPCCGIATLVFEECNDLMKSGCCGRLLDIQPGRTPQKPKLVARDCECGKNIYTLSRFSGFVKTKCCGRTFFVLAGDSALLKGDHVPEEKEVLDLTKFAPFRVKRAAV